MRRAVRALLSTRLPSRNARHRRATTRNWPLAVACVTYIVYARRAFAGVSLSVVRAPFR